MLSENDKTTGIVASSVLGADDSTLLPATKRAFSHLGNVLVLGLGKSGKSVARYCANLLGTRVDALFVAAGARNNDSVAFVEEIAQLGATYAFGDEALSDVGMHFDVCIASPGIPYWHALYVAGSAHSDELISEVEFAWRESAADSTWVAITGTNGKTTTTACCAHVLEESGFAARAVGNIGDVCLDAVVAGKTAVYVAEVSSYQLYSTRYFAPDVAVLLNITPDHIHWHKTLEAYAQAKFKIIENMGSDVRGATGIEPYGLQDIDECTPGLESPANCAYKPVVVLDATNDVVRAKVREIKAIPSDNRGYAYIPMGTADGIGGDMRAKCGAENAAFINAQGRMFVAYNGVQHSLACAQDLQIKGEHNASNALAAACVALALGADDAAITRSLQTFKPLEHRIEPCASVAGVACYNDSKATNVDATVKALQAFPGKRLVIMLGGEDKGTDLADLIDAVCAHAAVAVCFGDAAPRFVQAFENSACAARAGFACVRAGHLEDALDVALAHAHPGDVVLLSPACASFDEFNSFEQRGSVFKQLVANRAEQVGA